MQFQGQAVGVPEEGHSFIGIGIPADGLGLDTEAIQPRHGLVHIRHPEGRGVQLVPGAHAGDDGHPGGLGRRGISMPAVLAIKKNANSDPVLVSKLASNEI